MKIKWKTKTAAGLCLILLTSCAKAAPAADTASASAATAAATPASDYQAYQNAFDSCPTAASWTAAVQDSYVMSYSDDTKDAYDMDGVLEVSNAAGSPTAHLSQNIDANGMNSVLAGYYTDGRLYNTYNSVNYYEDMDFSSLKKSMLVPLDPVRFAEGEIASLQISTTEDGTAYTIQLKDAAALSYFNDRYDVYGLQQYSNFKILSNSITDTFNADGYFIKETADFSTSLTQDSQAVQVSVSSSLSYLKLNETEVAISDTLKQTLAAYVSYKDIDTAAIQTETTDDDSAEATVTDTFKKRLISRLNYKIDSGGTYSSNFNTNEAYIVDFANDLFTYSNYSITYVYNWRGDVGGYESCNYDFTTGQASSSCDDTKIDSIKNVKNSFEMELYYCGLSLEDLQKESQ